MGAFRDAIVGAGYLRQDMQADQGRENALEGQRLDLEGRRMANDEAKTQYETTKKVRGVNTQSWDDAQRASGLRNEQIRTQNEPEAITNPDGSTGFRNRQTGEVFSDKARAYGVVPLTTTQGIFEQEYAGKVRDAYMQAGMPEKAAQFDDWMKSQTGKRYLSEAHKGLAAIAQGDKHGGLRILQDLYNSQIHDGRYASYQDNGDGSTTIIVRDTKTGEVHKSQPIPDSELGLRAAHSFLSPQVLAENALARETASAKLTAQFNVDVAKKRIEASLHDNSKAQEIALQTRGKLVEMVGHAQLDAMLGKGAHVTMDQLGQNIIVTVPGQGVFKLEKDGLKPVQGGAFRPQGQTFSLGLGDLLGAPSATGVQTQPSNPVTAPTAAPASGVQIPQGAIDMLKAGNTPELRKFFDSKYGAGASDKVLPAAKTPAPAAAPTPTPAPTPVPAVPSAEPTPAAALPAAAPAPAPILSTQGQVKNLEQMQKQIDEAKAKLRAAGGLRNRQARSEIQAQIEQLQSAYDQAQAAYEQNMRGRGVTAVTGRVFK